MNAILDHGFEQGEGAADIVAIILVRLLARFEIPGLDHRRNQALLYHGDLFGKGRFGKDITPAGSRMCEHPRDDNLLAVSFGMKPANQIGPDFGNGVGRGGVEGTILIDRQFLSRDSAEDLR